MGPSVINDLFIDGNLVEPLTDYYLYSFCILNLAMEDLLVTGSSNEDSQSGIVVKASGL